MRLLETITALKSQKTALVTGGAGFIGSNLSLYLLKKGYAVYAVDNLITGSRENLVAHASHKQFEFVELDITSPRFFQKFERINLHCIYHLACPTGVPNIRILGEEMLRTSSIGTMQVLELARRHQSKVVVTSSAEVYGDPEVTPQNESYTGNVDPIGPRSAYEEGKRFKEAVSALYARKYKLAVKIVRIFNTYGPGMSFSDERVIPRFLRAVSRGEPLTVYGDGTQTRTLLYVDDLLEGLWLVMQKGSPGEAYNVGGDKQIAMRDLALKILSLNGHASRIVFRPHFINDHRRREPSLSKIKSLGWRQTISLDEGLRRMLAYVEWHRQAPLAQSQRTKTAEASLATKNNKHRP